MKRTIIPILLSMIFTYEANAQRAFIRQQVIDTVLMRTSQYLLLDKPNYPHSYNLGIRVIDLTGWYKNCGSYTFLHSYDIKVFRTIPTNLNSGMYRDIVFVKQTKKKKIYKLSVHFCLYEPRDYFIQGFFHGDIDFEIVHDKVVIHRCKIIRLDA